mmetsp:Transcript_17481/g.29998  ORF Transcript_17481/g.29998 Transcript_17481/m.29998 type:complete len:88 (+) Transcript_17481:206-469(+)
MGGHYDEVEIEDMTWNEELMAFTYQCPCGDLFQISREELQSGEEMAHCPSCSLFILVVYNPDDYPPPPAPVVESVLPPAHAVEVEVA